MPEILPVLMLLLGAACGAGGVWLLLRARIEQARREAVAQAEVERATLNERLQAGAAQIGKLETAVAREQAEKEAFRRSEAQLQQDAVKLTTTLENERAQMAQTLATLEKAQQELSDAFKALAAESLKSNNESFLTLAKQTFEKFQTAAQADLEKRHQAIGTLVQPVKESLEKVQEQIRGIETVRAGAYAGLSEQVKHLAESDEKLRSETANLVKALRAPQVRGRWGEIQLRRVVELAGMIEYCDFRQQVSETTEEGRLRPDLVVRLPGDLQVIVDAKVPLAAYLEALEAWPDEEVAPPAQAPRPRPPVAQSRGPAKQKGLLGAIPAVARFRDPVPAGRGVLQRGLGARSAID